MFSIRAVLFYHEDVSSEIPEHGTAWHAPCRVKEGDKWLITMFKVPVGRASEAPGKVLETCIGRDMTWTLYESGTQSLLLWIWATVMFGDCRAYVPSPWSRGARIKWSADKRNCSTWAQPECSGQSLVQINWCWYSSTVSTSCCNIPSMTNWNWFIVNARIREFALSDCVGERLLILYTDRVQCQFEIWKDTRAGNQNHF